MFRWTVSTISGINIAAVFTLGKSSMVRRCRIVVTKVVRTIGQEKNMK